MIPVRPQPEYKGFEGQVRRPGQRFLAANPSPSSREFRNRDYWRRAKKELHRAYVRCAYTSLRIMGTRGTVDHFRPKVKFPHLAYEWSNYRLARAKLNNRKGDSLDVIDPFRVRSGWFILDCPSCLIHPGENLEKRTRDQVRATINVLNLNSGDLVQERSVQLVDFAMGKVPFDHLEKHYPFLANEIRRQRIEDQMRTLFAV